MATIVRVRINPTGMDHEDLADLLAEIVEATTSLRVEMTGQFYLTLYGITTEGREWLQAKVGEEEPIRGVTYSRQNDDDDD